MTSLWQRLRRGDFYPRRFLNAFLYYWSYGWSRFDQRRARGDFFKE